MTGYTKLFGSIIASTIWREPNETRIVWITMLAMANKNGVVEASVPGLADMSRVTVDECKEAVKALESPDEYSRTKEHEGRRIRPIDGGWEILNHAKYRAKMGADERREYFRVKKAESRAKSKCPKRVHKSPRLSTESTQSEAQSNSEPKAEEKEISAHAVLIKLWDEAYPLHHDGEKYLFQGGRDAKAVEGLLKTGKTPQQLVAMAQAAWGMNDFHTSRAATLNGFFTSFNDIRNELNKAREQAKPKHIPTQGQHGPTRWV